MNFECFDLQVRDRVAHLVLNRPEKRNALSLAFWRELPRAVRELDDAAQARVLVISSTGSNFSSGVDTSLFGSFLASADGRDHGTGDTLEQAALWIAGLVPGEQVMDAARANAERRTADFVDLPPRRAMD